MTEKALTAVIHEAFVHGISTRAVDDLVKAMGMSGVSKSQVSRFVRRDRRGVRTFLDRPIEGDWPYLWVDTAYVKVLQNGHAGPVAVTIAVGVNGDRRREVLRRGAAPPRPRPSGPPSSESSRAAACVASCWSSSAIST